MARLLAIQTEQGHRKGDVILPRVTTDQRTRRVTTSRVADGQIVAAVDCVAVERGLEVRLDGESFAVIMRTPGADDALAAGFLLSEGVIDSGSDVAGLDCDEAADIVDVRLAPAASARARQNRDARRRVTMNASCGTCGRASLDALIVAAPVVVADWSVDPAVIVSLPRALARVQSAFAETGGLHAAALASRDGVLADSAEDVGRHNAVDKIVGRALLAGLLPLSSSMLVVSGRTSFEIVQKAWIAGVALVAAVSAPSSLAIELAERAGITLIGFVRDERFNVYTHARRVQA